MRLSLGNKKLSEKKPKNVNKLVVMANLERVAVTTLGLSFLVIVFLLKDEF